MKCDSSASHGRALRFQLSAMVLAGTLVIPLFAEEPDTSSWERVEPLPQRFSQHTDKQGIRWGLTQEGSVGLSGQGDASPAFGLPGGLAVNNQPFKVKSARVSSDESEVELTGSCGRFSVTRRIWIDRARGGARFIDTFGNPHRPEFNLAITLEVQNVSEPPHRLNNEALPAASAEGVELNRDETLIFPVPDEEGYVGCLWMLGDSKGEAPAHWLPTASNNAARLQWKLRVPAEGQVSVMYWVVQRPGLALGQGEEVLKAFWKHGRLAEPRVPAALASTVVNFSARQFQSDAAPSSAEWLLPLTRFAQSLGVERGAEDAYWMNASSVLNGEVSGAPLVIASRFGSVEAPLSEIAAVQGAGGGGRVPKVFLRDGLVLPGALTLPDWKITGSRGWTIQLQPETLEGLVLRAQPVDGTTTGSATTLARLTSGEVIPLRWNENETLSLSTPWGPLEVPLTAIRLFWHVRAPAPACRVWLADGSKLTVFPLSREVAAENARLGAVRFAVTDISALWQPGYELPAPDEEPEEIAEVAELQATAGCLLKGQNLVAATLADPELVLQTGAAQTRVPTAEIQELKRLESLPDAAPLFQLTLAGGTTFQGSLAQETLSLKVGASTWQVPLPHLLAYKRLEPATPAQ